MAQTGGPPNEDNKEIAKLSSLEEHSASNQGEPEKTLHLASLQPGSHLQLATSSEGEPLEVYPPASKWPPKVPVGRMSHKSVNELYKAMGIVGSRQLFDSKIDEIIETLKKDSPTGQIRRGHVSLFFTARDFARVHGMLFWGLANSPDIDDDDLHLKIAQYIGDRNQLFKNRVNDSNYRKRQHKLKSNSGTPQPTKAPKLTTEVVVPKRARGRDVTKNPPTRPRNEDVDTEDSEEDPRGGENSIQNFDHPSHRPGTPTSHVDSNPSRQSGPRPQHNIFKPLESPNGRSRARTFLPHLVAATDLRVKFKQTANKSTLTTRARTKVSFSQLSTFESFFPGVVQILSERYPEAVNATSGELSYAWDEENSLEIRNGEVEDWNAFVADMEERWRTLSGGGKAKGKAKRAKENRPNEGEPRLKIYFDLLGSWV